MFESGAYIEWMREKHFRYAALKRMAQILLGEQARHLALSNGMKTLLGYGLELARQGHTSLEEVERVLLTDSGLEQEIRARNLSTATCVGCGAGLRDEWLDCPYCLTPRGTLQ